MAELLANFVTILANYQFWQFWHLS